MKRIVPAIIILVALFIAAIIITKPLMGDVTDTWQTENQSFKVRVIQRAERWCTFVCGAYYVFQSAPSGSNDWREVMTFRHDDPVEIPREKVRMVDDNVGYVFMGWMYAVTTDGGITWTISDISKNLPDGERCGYNCIQDLRIEANGRGIITLRIIGTSDYAPRTQKTEDYGQHWSL